MGAKGTTMSGTRNRYVTLAAASPPVSRTGTCNAVDDRDTVTHRTAETNHHARRPLG